MGDDIVKYRISSFCVGCGRCEEICPAGCIDSMAVPFAIEEERCLRCGRCFSSCPRGAVERVSEKNK